MILTTSEEDRSRYPDREWFRCEQCRMSAYKDVSGAHYIPITHTRDSPSEPRTAITASTKVTKKPSDWRLKFRRSKRDWT